MSIGITAIGMTTSMGGTVSACAAARAKLTNPTELKVMSFGHEALFGEEEGDELATVSGHATQGIADGFVGFGKVLALGAKALEELLASRPLAPRDLAKTGLFVNLKDGAIEDADHAETTSGREASDEPAPAPPSVAFRRKAEVLTERLAASAAFAAPLGATMVRFGGHAGFAALVEEARARIERGALDRCIVGGVESRVEPRFLSAAARLNLLRTNRNPVGLAPGEAACFLMLERAEDVAKAGGALKALVTSAVSAVDERSYLGADPPDGQGLASVLARAAQSTSPGLLLSDHNGLERRAFDVGNAIVRLRAEHRLDALPTWYPAASFGDTGAAAGALACAMAARAFERGYAPAGGAVVALASETGERGAVGLTRPVR